MVTFTESVFRFTDPIRYFKANDPIYYEVDNIPLKQLQENTLWLKDQIEKIVIPPPPVSVTSTSPTTTTQSNNSQNITRSQFAELKPYINGGNNIVYVNPGRFTARINDAYKIQQLQSIIQTGGLEAGQFNIYEFKTNIDQFLVSSLNKFKAKLPSNALGMNGLYERAFTYAMRTNDVPSQFLRKALPGYSENQPGRQVPFPNNFGRVAVYGTDVSSITTSYWNSTDGFWTLPGMESEFIKRWRGVTRTAVVDVPETLSITIPPFNAADFTYEDQLGIDQQVEGATQRIDLLFIYSKPVDTSSVTINQFDQTNNSPRKITSPVLGLVKGAGIGITSYRAGTQGYGEVDLVDGTTPFGNNQIIPNTADQVGTNLGFSGYLKGSFPSPDDLMNLAPLISEQLETDHIALIGQSVLPVAYVIVRQNASQNAAGQPILVNSDIIDIRPFFRTTELSYNERAGIAAATPQVSIANPVATEAYVDLVANQLRQIIPPPPPAGVSFERPRIIHSGYICGGFSWGVESTLFNYLKSTNQNLGVDEGRSQVKQFYGYPVSRTISNTPDWDRAVWCDQTFNNPGQLPHDYINYHFKTWPRAKGGNAAGGNNNGPATGKNNQKFFYGDSSITTYASSKFAGGVNNGGAQGNKVAFFWVSKKIRITLPSWAEDFRVDTKFFNCIPLTSNSGEVRSRDTQQPYAKSSGLFTSKRRISGNVSEFTIFAMWAGPDQKDHYNGNDLLVPSLNRDIQNTVTNFNGFIVLNDEIQQVRDSNQGAWQSGDLFSTTPYPGDIAQTSYPNAVGVALYPTVTFDVVGIPSGYGTSINYGEEDTIVIPETL